jgi:DNA-binding NarL/FixJ family response regulator
MVLDLTMPHMDGLEALPRLRDAAPEAEIVVLTASEDDANLLAAIRGGAAGYPLKSEPPERIVGFLNGVTQGEVALSGPVARRLLEQVREGDRRAPAVAESIAAALSARALEVLLLLDQHLGTEDRAAADHLGAHGALPSQEPAREARRLLAP